MYPLLPRIPELGRTRRFLSPLAHFIPRPLGAPRCLLRERQERVVWVVRAVTIQTDRAHIGEQFTVTTGIREVMHMELARPAPALLALSIRSADGRCPNSAPM